MTTVITWHTKTEPDQAGMALILSALKSNRRMRHAEFRLAAPNEIDPEGTIQIQNQDPHKMISPGAVSDLIHECLS